MNGRSLTEARISEGLRAHLPQRAPAGLRELIVDAAETTTQQRALRSFLGALMEADPVARRRSLLIAAALLLAVAVASAAAVGAWRLLQRESIDELSLEPPDDVPAFVLSSYERLLQLPPVALAWHDSGSAKGRIYVDRSGAVRFDRFTSADATEASSYTILRGNRISGMALVDSQAVWVEPGHEAVDDNARGYIRTVLNAGGNAADAPGCEMERDPSAVGDVSAATGWRYIGVEYVAGRPTHHVACAGKLSVDTDLWLDIETRLILRMREPLADDAGQPIPGQFGTIEVTEITFGELPAALFEAPQGVAHMTPEAYSAYLCTRDTRIEEEVGLGVRDCSTPTEAEATPPPEPSPTPMPTALPNTSACAVAPRDASAPLGPLAWTPQSLKKDWPAPVRSEPAGGASVRPMPPMYRDPTGDNGSKAYPCVDIRWAMADTSAVHLKLVSKPPPWSCPESRTCLGADPTEQWIAYGVVTDEDRDGVPDWRYGIDNMPADAAEKGPPRRGWRTNLHTGQTEAGPEHGDPVWFNGGGFRSGLPPESADWEPDAIFEFGGAIDTTQGSQKWGFELDVPFYAWASVIVDGRVVATDYAPDSGWLVATPGVAIKPNQFPGGAYQVQIEYADLGSEPVTGFLAQEEMRPPIRVSMIVPHGWIVGGPWGESDGNAHLEFNVVGHPWDGCPDTTEPELGPSFDDLVTYLAELPRIDISQSTDVTVDGYRGKYLSYKPVDKWFDCFSASPIHADPGDNEAWIVDVDGVRVVIAVVSGEPVSATVMSEARQIVESIHFEH
jgi:hypothetical protein